MKNNFSLILPRPITTGYRHYRGPVGGSEYYGITYMFSDMFFIDSLEYEYSFWLFSFFFCFVMQLVRCNETLQQDSCLNKRKNQLQVHFLNIFRFLILSDQLGKRDTVILEVIAILPSP